MNDEMQHGDPALASKFRQIGVLLAHVAWPQQVHCVGKQGGGSNRRDNASNCQRFMQALLIEPSLGKGLEEETVGGQ